MWGVRTFSPAVPPGDYSVRLTAGGDTQSVPLTVQGNPWVTDVTDADMIAQFEFGQQVRDKVTEANRAVIAIRNMKAQLENRLERSDDGRLRDAAGRLDTAASDVEGVIYQVRNQANQDPLNFPIRVNNRLANLMSMSERGDGRPGNNMPVIFDILVDELQGYTDRLEVIWSEELAAVNAILGGLDLPAIDPNCDSPDGCMIT